MKWRQAAVLLLALAAPGGGTAGAQTKPALSPAYVDHLIRAEWHRAKIVPAPPVDDARFLRRVYLDVTGTIPPPETVTAFLADRSPDKRARAVQVLLDSPRYADCWTDYWDDALMGRPLRAGQLVDRLAFRQWLHEQFEKNAPWNKLVYDLITASGQNSAGGSYAKSVGFMAPQDQAQDTTDAGRVNGAVNWLLKYAQNPADLSGSASKIFLGVQIQCAQCHDHKTEHWKQDDFRRFTACFVNARPRPLDIGKVKGIRRVDVEDLNRPFLGGRRIAAGRNEFLRVAPAALDGTDFSDSPNRRQALAAWMTAPENPWFAEAIVNRMWAHFLGRGFVDPIDDFRSSNPPVMPGLLKLLADDFAAHGYDLKHLIKLICATQVYQLSSALAQKTDSENRLWARYRLKPMEPEALLDALVQATNLQPVLERIAGSNLEQLKFAMRRQFTFLFDVDEEFEQKEFEGTIPQALLLLNGSLTNRAVTPIPGTALADVLAMPGGDAQKVAALYLRTLSRRPTAVELKRWTAFVSAPRPPITGETVPPLSGARERLQPGAGKAIRRGGSPDPLNRLAGRFRPTDTSPGAQAYEDLFWALLNSSEFMFNH